MSSQKPVEAVLKEKKIYQITNPKLVQAAPDVSVKKAIELMQENKAGYIVLSKNKKVVGMFTETDVARKILGRNIDWNGPVLDYMTKDPTVLTPKDSVGKAINLMRTHSFYHIPLVDEKNHLSGILSVRSLIRFLAEFYPTEVYNLPPDPTQVMETQEGG
jgi:CBS domain-containing protein